MKKVGILLMLILSISFISAIDISLQKSSYNSMETLQAEISGGFIDNLVLDNINIYQAGAVHPMGGEANFVKYNDKYYYYAIVPQAAGSYSLRIENTKHYVGTHESTDTVEQNFTVVESTSPYLSFSPGVVYTSKDFSITVTAYNKNQDVSVDFPEAGFKQTFNLGYNQVKTYYISIANITNTTVSKINVGSYSIPAIIITQKSAVNTTNTTNVVRVDLADAIKLNPREINATMLANAENTYEISLKAINQTIGDLKVSSSNSNMNVSLVSDQTIIIVKIVGKESFSGFINLSTEDSSLIIPVDIQITKNISNVSYSTIPVDFGKTCAQMNGKYCLEGQTCSALQKVDSIGNLCCIGECNASSSGSTWLWIILVLAIIGVGGWYLYTKSKEGQDFGKLTNNILSKRTEDYKKRIEAEPKEVRSGLTKN